MRWITAVIVMSQVAMAMKPFDLPSSNNMGIGITMDQTHGTASVAYYDGKICNVAMIPGDAAYLEYMCNATTGSFSSTGETIPFPTYKPARRIQDVTPTPLETMFFDLMKAAAEVASYPGKWWRNPLMVSLPLVFTDGNYAELLELDFLHILFYDLYIHVDKYELGGAALATSGDICLLPAHPLMPNMTNIQPLSIFRRSAVKSVAHLDAHDTSFADFNVRFRCPRLPDLEELEQLFEDASTVQATKWLTIDGRLY